MPSSRSAKTICQDLGADSISCKVAKNRERRRKSEGRETASPKPQIIKKKPVNAIKDRSTYLEDRIREATEG